MHRHSLDTWAGLRQVCGRGPCTHKAPARAQPCRALLESFRRADIKAQASFKDHKLDEQTERTLFDSVGQGLKKGSITISTAVTGGAEKIGDFFMCAACFFRCPCLGCIAVLGAQPACRRLDGSCPSGWHFAAASALMRLLPVQRTVSLPP